MGCIKRRHRQAHLSIRTLKRTIRRCSWRCVLRVRDELTPYRARTASVRPGLGRARVMSWVDLKDILRAQVAVADAQGDLVDDMKGPLKLIICADATPMWKTSATRCDVFLDCRRTKWGGNVLPLPIRATTGACGRPANWSTWWIMDGSDDANQGVS